MMVNVAVPDGPAEERKDDVEPLRASVASIPLASVMVKPTGVV